MGLLWDQLEAEMAMKPPCHSGKPCADYEPRCWGSLITGSLDMCTPDFVPGARREHSPANLPRISPRPASLACTAAAIPATYH